MAAASAPPPATPPRGGESVSVPYSPDEKINHFREWAKANNIPSFKQHGRIPFACSRCGKDQGFLDYTEARFLSSESKLLLSPSNERTLTKWRKHQRGDGCRAGNEDAAQPPADDADAPDPDSPGPDSPDRTPTLPPTSLQDSFESAQKEDEESKQAANEGGAAAAAAASSSTAAASSTASSSAAIRSPMCTPRRPGGRPARLTSSTSPAASASAAASSATATTSAISPSSAASSATSPLSAVHSPGAVDARVVKINKPVHRCEQGHAWSRSESSRHRMCDVAGCDACWWQCAGVSSSTIWNEFVEHMRVAHNITTVTCADQHVSALATNEDTCGDVIGTSVCGKPVRSKCARCRMYSHTSLGNGCSFCSSASRSSRSPPPPRKATSRPEQHSPVSDHDESAPDAQVPERGSMSTAHRRDDARGAARASLLGASGTSVPSQPAAADASGASTAQPIAGAVARPVDAVAAVDSAAGDPVQDADAVAAAAQHTAM